MEMREDVFSATITASLKPEPWELQKKMNSPKSVNRLKNKVKKQFDTLDGENSSQQNSQRAQMVVASQNEQAMMSA